MKSTTIVAAGGQSAEAATKIPEPVAVAADDLGATLPLGAAMADNLAYVWAALRSQGWDGPAGAAVINAVTADLPRRHTRQELEAAQQKARGITEPWPVLVERAREYARSLMQWESELEEAQEEAECAVERFRAALSEFPSPDAVASGGDLLDLDGEPQPPPWLVPGMIVRGRAHLISGDTGSFKSGFRSALMAAGLRGEPFLGRPVHARRFMVIDGENPRDEIVSQWRALGLRNKHMKNVHFVGAEARVELGTPQWNERLEREVEAFRPDVVFIDSVARTTAVAVLDNDSVVDLYAKTLGPLVAKYDLAIVLVHHERKGGGSGDRSQAALGARQWANQADAHLTLAAVGPYEETPAARGGVDTRRRFALRVPKMRGGLVDRPEHFEVRGRKREDGALVALELGAPKALTAAEEIIAAADKPLGRSELAKAAGMRHDGQRFRGGLKEAIESGRLEQREDALYERAAA